VIKCLFLPVSVDVLVLLCTMMKCYLHKPFWLQRTVKEAVTALLGGGIRIGVLVQGKKVRDDNNTLSQTGLSCRENLGNLGFTLEPGLETLPVPLCSETPVLSLPTDSTKLSERY